MAEGLITRRGGGGYVPISASGGTITEATVGMIIYRIHTFTTVGSSNFVVDYAPPGAEVEYLIIAGSGGGVGSASCCLGAGGGGAGGYRCSVQGESSGGLAPAEPPVAITAQTYPIVVGAGGTGANNGQNSSAFGIVSIGGGHGQAWAGTSSAVGSGGSGGGSHASGAGTPAVGAGTTNQGLSGGFVSGPDSNRGGGGGGAGSAGIAGSSTGGQGGGGITSSITGSPVTRAGGGGGSVRTNLVGGLGAAGGIGGGGNGYNADQTGGTNGAANTGGGGGGGVGGAAETHTSGGSGVVIIRYPIGVV